MIPSTSLNIAERDTTCEVSVLKYDAGFFDSPLLERTPLSDSLFGIDEVFAIQGTTRLFLVCSGGERLVTYDCIGRIILDNIVLGRTPTRYTTFAGVGKSFRFAAILDSKLIVIQIGSDGKLKQQDVATLPPRANFLQLAVCPMFLAYTYALRRSFFCIVINVNRPDNKGELQLSAQPLSLVFSNPEFSASGSSVMTGSIIYKGSGMDFNILGILFKDGKAFTLREYKVRFGDMTPNPVEIKVTGKYAYRDSYNYYDMFLYEGIGGNAAVTNLSLHENPRAPGFDRPNAALIETNFVVQAPHVHPVFDSSIDGLYFITSTPTKSKTKEKPGISLYYLGTRAHIVSLPHELSGGDSEIVSAAFASTFVIYFVIKSKNKKRSGLYAIGSEEDSAKRFITIREAYQYTSTLSFIDKSRRSMCFVYSDHIELVHADLTGRYWALTPTYAEVFSEDPLSKPDWSFERPGRHYIKSYSYSSDAQGGYLLNLEVTVKDEELGDDDITFSLPLYPGEFNAEVVRQLLGEEYGDRVDPNAPRQSVQIRKSCVSDRPSFRYTTKSICLDGNVSDMLAETFKTDTEAVSRHFIDTEPVIRPDEYNDEDFDDVPEPELDPEPEPEIGETMKSEVNQGTELAMDQLPLPPPAISFEEVPAIKTRENSILDPPPSNTMGTTEPHEQEPITASTISAAAIAPPPNPALEVAKPIANNSAEPIVAPASTKADDVNSQPAPIAMRPKVEVPPLPLSIAESTPKAGESNVPLVIAGGLALALLYIVFMRR
ncbi:hypothetical protein GMRT_15554 [Giardia muris]|uniref:Uncharacterized protein n=1 Tax=Giardia muris TaxID=5742 RepID=A0A4Z1SSL7_GIAMU|nr:hypothetical protein GMRT_15554 [Giardia muris]|eukprot:TNJ28854.1 hypothetical protein GMRT_15554 [Giardia muris]